MDLVPPSAPDNRSSVIMHFLTSVKRGFSGFPFVMWLSKKPDAKKKE
jgi:hypothetical protein